jgi:hypothetical protein
MDAPFRPASKWKRPSLTVQIKLAFSDGLSDPCRDRNTNRKGEIANDYIDSGRERHARSYGEQQETEG